MGLINTGRFLFPSVMSLQARAVDDLHVDAELAAAVVEDEHADAATARVEGGLETLPEVGLVHDGEVLLDVTGLGHGDDLALLHVEDAVLLEDRPEHGLDDNARGGVSNEGALLVELLGEQINTEVAVLAGGGRGGDPDDLAGAVLEHQEVADPDVVAGDRDRVGHNGNAGIGTGTASRLGALYREALPAAHVAARVIFVVVTHLGLFLDAGAARLFNSGVVDVSAVFGADAAGPGAGVYGVLVDDAGGGLLVDGAVVASVDGEGVVGAGLDAGAVLAFGNVNGAGGVVLLVVLVYLDAGLCEVGTRGSVLLSVVVTLVTLGLGPLGTVAILLLTSVLELVLVELNLLVRARGRRLLGFGPRGSELDLLGGGGSGGGGVDLGLGLRLLVRRWEDAEGDRNAGFKVQIDGCGGRRSKTFRNRPFAN